MAKGKNYASMPMPAGMEDSCSMSVRKIDNGYLVSKTHFDGKTFKESTVYSATKPEITMTGSAPAGKKR